MKECQNCEQLGSLFRELEEEKIDLEAKLSIAELQILEMKELISRLQSQYSGVPVE